MQERFAKIAHLIFKHLEGQLSAEEQHELDEWLSEDEQHRTFFNRITQKDELVKELKEFRQPDKSRQFQLLYNRIFTRKTAWWRYAAAAAVLVMLAAGLFRILNNKSAIADTDTIAFNEVKNTASDIYGSNLIGGEDTVTILTLSNGTPINFDSVPNGALSLQGNTKLSKWGDQLSYETAIAKKAGVVLYNTISIPRGGKTKFQVTLDDGTRIFLGAESVLRYPTAFTGDERVVELVGQAYFEVAKNKEKPFRVNVPGKNPNSRKAQIEVLGTHFNVMAYPEDSTVKTTLIEGSVKVNNDIQSILLQPGQLANIPANGYIQVQEQIDTNAVVGWKSGMFEFEKMPIKTIMRQVARWYNMDVVYQSETDHLFTGFINREESVDVILSSLELIGVVHFDVQGNTITVYPGRRKK